MFVNVYCAIIEQQYDGRIRGHNVASVFHVLLECTKMTDCFGFYITHTISNWISFTFELLISNIFEKSLKFPLESTDSI